MISLFSFQLDFLSIKVMFAPLANAPCWLWCSIGKPVRYSTRIVMTPEWILVKLHDLLREGLWLKLNFYAFFLQNWKRSVKLSATTIPYMPWIPKCYTISSLGSFKTLSNEFEIYVHNPQYLVLLFVYCFNDFLNRYYPRPDLCSNISTANLKVLIILML